MNTDGNPLSDILAQGASVGKSHLFLHPDGGVDRFYIVWQNYATWATPRSSRSAQGILTGRPRLAIRQADSFRDATFGAADRSQCWWQAQQHQRTITTPTSMAQSRPYEETQPRLLHVKQLATTGLIAASVAHEISNILQSVLLHLGLLTDGIAGPAQAHLDLTLREVAHAAEIARWLLQGALPAHDQRDRVDLLELVNEALRLAAGQIKDAEVAIQLHSDREVPSLVIAAGAMRQVFLNLVLNAVEAMPQGGKLDIAIRRRGGQVEIAFMDTGAGIHPADLDRVFEPFFTRKETGSGLGLWLCQHVVTAHNGTIELQSEPGVGTTARIRLPLPASDPSPAQ